MTIGIFIFMNYHSIEPWQYKFDAGIIEQKNLSSLYIIKHFNWIFDYHNFVSLQKSANLLCYWLINYVFTISNLFFLVINLSKGLNSGRTSCGSVHKETSSSPAGLASASASEKRRKLLGALEKCDEDLKVLKKVIETARSVEHIRSPAIVNEEGCGDFNSERWRSVLLLDELTRLPLGSYPKKRANG